jgi:hypothetical protein
MLNNYNELGVWELRENPWFLCKGLVNLFLMREDKMIKSCMCLTWSKLYQFDDVSGLYMWNIVYVEVIKNILLLDPGINPKLI